MNARTRRGGILAREQFPEIGDLELGKIRVPTLLVHGTADTDVRPDQTDNAAGRIPGAQVIRVPNGTHLCTWADPASADVHERITAAINGAWPRRNSLAQRPVHVPVADRYQLDRRSACGLPEEIGAF